MIAGAISSRVFATVAGGLFLDALGVAWISVGRGFLVQNDSDVDKGVKNMVNTDDCGGSVMGVKVKKVKQGLYYIATISKHDMWENGCITNP